MDIANPFPDNCHFHSKGLLISRSETHIATDTEWRKEDEK